jgi:membrane-associated phospholipid phosphatase
VNVSPESLDALVARRRALLIRAAAGLAALALACWVVAKTTDLLSGPGGLDPGRTRAQVNPDFRWMLDVVVFLGNPLVALLTVAALSLAAGRMWGRRFGVLILVAASIVVATSVLKAAGPQTSLPSGHTAYAVALFGTAAWLALRAGHRAFALAFVAPALAMGPTRVLEGAHHPADAIAGAALGLAWAIAIVVAGVPWAARRSAPRAVA